ncbi:lipopolysaccharide biosynthesis protein [Aeromicrobium sp. NPDC092404]|uniref:lipopolysaccharide biosynthesis protein n=1 Tax=Aeromicrobium sp. NPDC092404 TaxID=3154976 RepID=UPI003414DE1E
MTPADAAPDKSVPRRGGGLRAFLSIAAAGFGVQLLTVASGPLVARMIGPEGRGQMVMVMLVAMLGALAGVGSLSPAIAHAVGSSGAPARDVVRGHLKVWILATLVPATVAAGLVAALVRDAPHQWLLAVECLAVSFCLSVQFLLGAMLQGEGNVRRINTQRLVGMASYVAAVAALFILDPVDDAAVILLIYILSLLGGFVVAWLMLRPPTGELDAQVDRRDVHAFARRGFISGLNALDAWGLDQLLVGLVLGSSALGLYAVAASATSFPSIVLAGIAAILLPRMAALPPAGAKAVMRRWLAAAIVLDLAMVGGMLLVIGPALRIFFGEEFVPATDVARILIVAWALLALRRVLVAAAQAQGRVAASSFAEAGSTVVLVASAFLGMHLWGLEGAGVALVVSAAIACVWVASTLSWGTGDAEGQPHEVDLVDVIELDDADPLMP